MLRHLTARRSLIFVLALSALAGTAMAAQGPDAGSRREPPAGTEATAGASEQKPVEAPAAGGTVEQEPGKPLIDSQGNRFPPDGKWLKDDQGREYFVDKLAKKGIAFKRLDEHRVRIIWGITLDLVREDDQYFYYKVYRTDDKKNVVTSVRPEPTAEEKAAVEAAYTSATGESDRLHFVAFSQGLPGSGQWRNGFRLADMNGDGHLDIVHGPARKGFGRPAIFLGDGHGHWTIWKTLKFSPASLDYGDVAVADFNGDGKMDLAFGCHLRGIVAFLGDGKGGFREWSKGIDFDPPRPGHAGGFSSRALTVVDWNGDGRPDLVALGEGPRVPLSPGAVGASLSSGTYGVVIYLNQGDGTWKRHAQGNDDSQVFGDSVAAGDLNGDGRPDLVTGSNEQGRRQILFYGGKDGSWETRDLVPLRPYSYVRAVRVGDFNGDGRNDLAVAYISFELASWRTAIDVFLGGSDGGWERKVVAAEDGAEAVYGLGVGDLDGDGKLDLVGTTGLGATWVFLGRGDGTFTREASPEIAPDPKECRGFYVDLVDLDGDGRADLVQSFAGEPSPPFHADRCTNRGAIRAWRSEPGPEPAGDKRP